MVRLLLAFLSCTASEVLSRAFGGKACTAPVSRIVGGERADPYEFPFMVMIGGQDDMLTCGGSLIAAEWVLTAAHCAIKPGSLVKIGANDVGDNDECVESIRVVAVFNHKDFNEFGNNDIALLKLASASVYAPVTLNTGSDVEQTGTSLVVSGWGLLDENGLESSETLQKVDVPVVEPSFCSQIYRREFNTDILPSMICAGLNEGGKDACQGDSGGPLFAEKSGGFVQVGLVSFGGGCARPGVPGVYTRVSSFVQWIQSIIDAAEEVRAVTQQKKPTKKEAKRIKKAEKKEAKRKRKEAKKAEKKRRKEEKKARNLRKARKKKEKIERKW